MPIPLPMPFDWDAERTCEEWKAVAYEFARMWSQQNASLLVDPSFIHFVSRETTDSKLFRLDDPVLMRRYVENLDAR